MLTRRELLKLSAGVGISTIVPANLLATEKNQRVIPDYEKPMFDLPAKIKESVIIEKIELLKRGGTYFVRTRSKSGTIGLIQTKQIEHFIPIFEKLVAPHFIGKDARQIETLIDEVYVANYKNVGLPFWCPVAYVEQSSLDLLGKVANKSVGELLGSVLRKEIPVYLSGSGRNTTAEEEVDVYVRGIETTGCKAVKFKIGGRMSRNLDAYPGRTETLIKLARKRLGDNIILYADANGSYNAQKGVEVGKMLESLNFAFFEEPCPWEELSETQALTKALNIPVACGEQDSSLWRFQWMMKNGVMNIVQPDINYNGGLIRTARVAKMAAAVGMKIVPHNTQTSAASVNILQFASCTPNIGSYMEHSWRRPQQSQSWFSPNFIINNGKLNIPDGPGFGVEFDPDYMSRAEVVAVIT
jgi:L-alanine-DL-glutamate epimerase-like enolase superfamily enzyme